MLIPFVKMHGLGNDFVILERTQLLPMLETKHIKLICDRRFGIGCDQLIITEPSATADIFMHIYNADGSEAGACGNATRCLGYLLTQQDQKNTHTIQTISGYLEAETFENGNVKVDFGPPSLKWQDIPLAEDVDTLNLPIDYNGLQNPVAVSVGNPHMVFFVYDVESVDLKKLGGTLTRHPLYVEGANVEIVEILGEHTLRLRVYERGVGITPACGTGAAASVVAAKHRGHIKTPTKVILDGGELLIDYQETVTMSGLVTLTFQGQLNSALLQDIT
ncbi:MAG: diaminopimelate epimerase [Candidatus Paracaedimonas acanthamoebae]|uniref:Diaminopimelate epimerase n=1 Tax=Candidatus Paracaedimonas acanthamoebae TaxID=244581 RepID=A0A8J7PYQ3_9PROT|nr:diaminopimelate epimerase [Candidatus Paracaedimonas acanthamoebae]